VSSNTQHPTLMSSNPPTTKCNEADRSLPEQ